MSVKPIIMKRRREVLVLHNAKYTASEIADVTGFSTRTVEGDIQWWKTQEEYKLKIGNPVMEILINYNQEYRDLLNLQKKEDTDASVKKACISARTDITTRIKTLLQESNNMHKEADKLDVRAVVVDLSPDRIREIVEWRRKMLEEEDEALNRPVNG